MSKRSKKDDTYHFIPEVRKTDSKKKPKITIETARNAIKTGMLVEQGKSESQIANELGINTKSVYNYKKRFQEIFPMAYDDEALAEWDRKKAKFYKALENKVAESLMQKICSPEASDIPPKELKACLDSLYKINRLEQGKSTENKAYSITTNTEPAIDLVEYQETPSDD